MSNALPIKGDNLWVKVVAMLQQNWASIESDGDRLCVWFINDASEVFDRMPFDSAEAAKVALDRNGFRRFADAPDLQGFLRAPQRPFREGSHPSGPIYSSGRYWL